METNSNIQSFGEIFTEEEQRLRKQYGLEKIMEIMEEYDITVFDLESDIQKELPLCLIQGGLF